MTRAVDNFRQDGFTLIELLVSLGIFLVITGAAFTLLGSSQQDFQLDTQVLSSFQEARLGLDQIVRDVNDAGYPPPSFNSGDPTLFAISPFAWSAGAGYFGAPCQIGTAGGGTCTTAAGDTAPGDFDLIIETNPNPQDPSCPPAPCPVQWIRYQLQVPPLVQVPTLMRGMTPKTPGAEPDAATSGVLVPFVQNVVNNPAQPIFSYTCDNPPLPQFPPPPTISCTSPLAGASNAPANIRDVIITLIVAAPLPDARTGQPRLVQLVGRGRRINPNL